MAKVKWAVAAHRRRKRECGKKDDERHPVGHLKKERFVEIPLRGRPTWRTRKLHLNELRKACENRKNDASLGQLENPQKIRMDAVG